MRLLATLILLPSLAGAQDITLPVELYDPGAAAAPADLVLPMPCGAAMAFQKVIVPVDVDDPLDDRRLRLGQSRPETGYSDYLRTEYLRGPFADEQTSFFFIGRYEMTQAQVRALSGDCGPYGRADRSAAGGLSWFDAVDLSRLYSEWLLANAAASLPPEAGGRAFLRLPTETEWEYAARGGAVIEATEFPLRHFFGDAKLGAYAMYQGAGSARGKLLPVGLRAPNPLGLYDIYGNAEEIMIEPFRLNAVGRDHGQTGGLVTRGGSVLSTADEIYSAQRTEYPMFDVATGKALAADTFGMRLVLTREVASSDQVVRGIIAEWMAQADSPATSDADALTELAAMIEEETDPRRQSALSGLQLQFRVARESAADALTEAAKSTLLSGTVFVGALADTTTRIRQRSDALRELVDNMRIASDQQRQAYTESAGRVSEELRELRSLQRAYLLSYRNALETLISEHQSATLETAFRLLQDELSLSGQDRILAGLHAFNTDLSHYAARPDMDEAELLAMALTR